MSLTSWHDAHKGIIINTNSSYKGLGGLRIGRGVGGSRKRTPLYLQVERQIEVLLLRGRYKAGDRIPPETELIGTLGVSRVTVRAGPAGRADRGGRRGRTGGGAGPAPASPRSRSSSVL